MPRLYGLRASSGRSLALFGALRRRRKAVTRLFGRCFAPVGAVAGPCRVFKRRLALFDAAGVVPRLSGRSLELLWGRAAPLFGFSFSFGIIIIIFYSSSDGRMSMSSLLVRRLPLSTLCVLYWSDPFYPFFHI